MKKLEVKELLIDEKGELGVGAIAFVDTPATQVNFMTFNEQKKFEFNEEKRIITGVAMIPDMPIYRNDNGHEYYVTFSSNTIQQIAIKLFKENNHSKVNLSHDSNQMVDDVLLFESFIVDTKRGVNPPSWQSDAVDGTWYVSYKVLNDEVWNRAKAGEFKGLSVEGIFNMIAKSNELQDKLENKTESVLDNFLNTFLKHSHINKENKFSNMNKVENAINAIKALFNEEPTASVETFTDVTLKDGTMVMIDTDSLQVGSKVTIKQGEEVVSVPDGTYKLEDGSAFITVDGVVTEIVMPEAPTAMSEAVDYQPQIDALKNEIQSMIDSMKALTKTNEVMASQVKSMFGVIELMAQTTPTPTEKPSAFASTKKESKLEELKHAFSQLKK